MYKRVFYPLMLLPIGLSTAHAQGKQAEASPNIILFLVDDMGWQDTSLPFAGKRTPYNNMYHTPNMERLARQGMMFTQAYASSVSSPSRCSLMTGANAARHRVTNWTLRRGVMTDPEHGVLSPPDWNYHGISQVAGLDHTFVAKSFVQLLKEHGYHTIHCGKAHWGAMDTPGENPHHFGFEVNIAGHAAGGLGSYLSEDNYGNPKNGEEKSVWSVPGMDKYWGSGLFLTEALTQEAMASLDKAREYGQPFFLLMSHYAVHIPISKDPRFYNKYKERGLSDQDAAYAALIEGMDKSLGDLMDYLERTGQAKNTIILFMSDNGGFAIPSHWRSGEPHTQNSPLSSGKGSLYEGGIREPMIVSWPGVVQAGSKSDDYLIIEDFYPTILEMAGVKGYKTPQEVDGVSFVPQLRGERPSRSNRKLYWNMPNNWGPEGPGISLNCAIRDGDYKLIYSYETGRKELYNIREDIGEKRDLSDEYPLLVKRLSRDLGRYLRRVGAQRPVVKATGLPCPWPDETYKATASSFK